MKNIILITLIILGAIPNVIYGQTFIKDLYSITELIEVNDQTFFIATNETNGQELWVTNGTKESTKLVKDINELGNGSPVNLTSFNNELYFAANDGYYGQELWKTDGTEEGTVLIKNIKKHFGQGSYPSNFTVFKNELYFTATDHYINGNFQLWKTDGTEMGTIKVYDAGPNKITNLFVANNKMYLKIGNLLEYDFSTNTIKQIVVDDEYPVISKFNSFKNGLYFIATINYSGQNIRFYRLDEGGNVILIQEFTQPQYGDIDIHNFTEVGDNVYFSITTDFNSDQDTDVLWKTDGTNEGTSIVKSFNWERHMSGSNISNFIEYNNELFFNSGNQNDYKLWKSDGTETGTAQAIDISVRNSVDMFLSNDLLYFSNPGGNLWSTDGTESNTYKISNLDVEKKSSDDFFDIKETKSDIYFESDFKDKRALYTLSKNPILEVEKGSHIIEVNSKVSFESKIDSVVKTILKIKNNGNSNLVFSKVKVVGQDFYINANPSGAVKFPQILEPNEQFEFEISYFPSSKGLKKGTLSILSNDVSSPIYTIELTGFADNEVGQNLNEYISLDKEIIFNSSSFLININNNSIQEDISINSLVGTLSIPNSNETHSYELIPSEGALDNQYFLIENNDLKTNDIFNFEQQNTYTLRVIATNNNTNETIEESIIISILDVVEDIALEECSLEVKNVGFGLYDVEFIDNNNAIAVGSHGSILKSNDGGNTWKKIRSDINNHLFNVQFTTNTIGYAIGDNILKTVDAGESWFTLKLPDVSYPIPTNLFFVNSDVGFVFGNNGKIFKTTDGGAYWKQKK